MKYRSALARVAATAVQRDRRRRRRRRLMRPVQHANCCAWHPAHLKPGRDEVLSQQRPTPAGPRRYLEGWPSAGTVRGHLPYQFLGLAGVTKRALPQRSLVVHLGGPVIPGGGQQLIVGRRERNDRRRILHERKPVRAPADTHDLDDELELFPRPVRTSTSASAHLPTSAPGGRRVNAESGFICAGQLR